MRHNLANDKSQWDYAYSVKESGIRNLLQSARCNDKCWIIHQSRCRNTMDLKIKQQIDEAWSVGDKNIIYTQWLAMPHLFCFFKHVYYEVVSKIGLELHFSFVFVDNNGRQLLKSHKIYITSQHKFTIQHMFLHNNWKSSRWFFSPLTKHPNI